MMANQGRELREWSASRPIRGREDELPVPNSSLCVRTQIPSLGCSAVEKRNGDRKTKVIPLDLGIFK